MTDRDKILQKTNGGFDVFVHYMGECCSKKVFRNPFREDTSPSCSIHLRKGSDRFYLKDFGDDSWSGDCFRFVAMLNGLDVRNDFVKILHIIDEELNLFVLDNAPVSYHQPVKVVPTVEPPKESRIISFTPKYRNFNKFELAYWQSYGIMLDTLERYDVRSLSSCSFERADGTSFTISSSKEIPMFCYLLNSGTGIKVYRPGVQIGRFLYAGNLPYPYVFGLDQLDLSVAKPAYPFLDSEQFRKSVLFITGGEKDVLSLAAHGFNAICLNSESAKTPLTLMKKLLDVYTLIVFLYDVDDSGKRYSAVRLAECESLESVSSHVYWSPVVNIHLPLTGSKQEKDVSDYFRLGHSASDLCRLVLSSLSAQ